MNQEEQVQEPRVVNQALAASYPESAAQYLGYRIAITVVGILLVLLGKQSLPMDKVECIQDGVLDLLIPVTQFYRHNKLIGTIFFAIVHIGVDIQLFAMAFFWFKYGVDFLYPISLGILGVTKIFLNWVFVVRMIQPHFSHKIIPSLLFGDNFDTTYFFSGTCAFLIMSCMQLRRMKFKKLWKIQLIYILYTIWILFSMRLCFFIDVTTGLVFGYYIYAAIRQNNQIITNKIFQLITTEEALNQQTEMT